MSTIQERLQLKRVPLDTWNIREQLCLASAVVRSGDQNWMSVSRALKTVGELNRPPDWYSQKSCAAQYGVLLEHVETPKRKKRYSEGGVETPQESILKKLTQERIVEIQKIIAEMNQQYEQLKNEITEVRLESTSEERIREMWMEVEIAKRTRERENARRAAWLKEREERRARADRTWRPPQQTSATPVSGVSVSGTPSSPLLTSLLKSSPVVTTPQHIPHPATVVETLSPSAGAPTLSMLLEKPGASVNAVSVIGANVANTTTMSSASNESKHAAIEHIKNQLVQIEQQLIASTSSSSQALPVVATPLAPVPLSVPVPSTPTLPAVDIDDIEIKAEDVFAFRDIINMHIPTVTGIHKDTNREVEKDMKKQEIEVAVSMVDEPIETAAVDHTRIQQAEVPSSDQQVSSTEFETVSTRSEVSEQNFHDTSTVVEVNPQPEVEIKISFPEVKFPTTEIKVIQPDDQKAQIKEEIKEPDEPEPELENPQEVKIEQETTPLIPIIEVKEEDSIPTEVESGLTVEISTEAIPTEPEQEEEEIIIQAPDPENIPLPPDPPSDYAIAQVVYVPPLPPDEPELPVSEDDVHEENQYSQQEPYEEHPEDLKPTESPKAEVQNEVGEIGNDTQEELVPLKDIRTEVTEEVPEVETRRETETSEEPEVIIESETKLEPEGKEKSDVVSEVPMKVQLDTKSEVETKPETNLKTEGAEIEDGHTETDDDTPMELSREEEKDGKKKRDYSRKKKPDSRTCSGSESATETSAPESPHQSDGERQHRLWKKSVMLVYNRLCAHKYASLFLRPITDEEAPGYSIVVKRPMDLTTIKRNIENGHIRTTAEFQRDVLLMLCNALMYNSSEHSVYMMAKDMHEEAQCQLGMLLAAQAHAGLDCTPAPATRKRRRADSPLPLHKRVHH